MKTPVEHPNTMIIEVFDKDTKIAEHTFVSIGGGKIEIDGKKGNVDPDKPPDIVSNTTIQISNVQYRFNMDFWCFFSAKGINSFKFLS